MALRKKRQSMSPKSGAPMEIDAHFRALLNISYSSPVRSPPSTIFQSPPYKTSEGSKASTILNTADSSLTDALLTGLTAATLKKKKKSKIHGHKFSSLH